MRDEREKKRERGKGDRKKIKKDTGDKKKERKKNGFYYVFLHFHNAYETRM